MSERSNVTASGFVKGIIGFSMPSYISTLITCAATYINTRVFDTAELGKINLFLTVQNLFIFIAFLGVDQSYCRYYYECDDEKDRKRLFSNCCMLSFYAIAFIAAAVVAFWRPLSMYIGGEASFFVAVSLVLSIAAHTVCRYISLLQRMEKRLIGYAALTVLISVANKLSYSISSLISNDYFTSIVAIVALYAGIAVCFWLASVSRSGIRLRRVDFHSAQIKRILRFGIPLMPISLLSWLNNSIPTLTMKSMISYDAVGIYSNAVVIASVVNLIQSGFSIFWVPFYYENYKDSNAKIRRVHDAITGLMVLFGICLMLCKDMLYVIVGSKYKSGSVVLPFLLISPICYTIGETTGIGISISEKSYLHSIVHAVGVLVNFTLCFFLMPHFGIPGAGFAVSISAIVSLTIKTFIGERYYKSINHYWKTFGVVLLLFATAIWDYSFSGSNIPLWIAGLCSAAAVVLLAYRKELVVAVKSVLSILKRK